MTDTQDMPADLLRAVQAIDAANFAEARQIAEEALAQGTDDLRYAFIFAQACMYQEDWQGLEAVADALIKTVPEMVIAHIWKGDSRRRFDDRAAALEHYEIAVSHAEKIADLPPAVEAALERAKAELPTLRRQLNPEG